MQTLIVHLAIQYGQQIVPPALGWVPITAYLLGSIPFGYLLVRMVGSGDIRMQGSGNIGATNVARRTGPLLGALTLFLDAAKGLLAVWIAQRASGENVRWMMLAALLAIAGHLFPIWLRFRGGRGVATGLGVFLPVCWPAVAIAIVIWLLVVIFWRYVSLASISAAAAVPLLVYVLYAPPHAPPLAVSLGSVTAVTLIIFAIAPTFSGFCRVPSPKLISAGVNR